LSFIGAVKCCHWTQFNGDSIRRHWGQIELTGGQLCHSA
jgi:hypothetical protein